MAYAATILINGHVFLVDVNNGADIQKFPVLSVPYIIHFNDVHFVAWYLIRNNLIIFQQLMCDKQLNEYDYWKVKSVMHVLSEVHNIEGSTSQSYAKFYFCLYLLLSSDFC